MPINLRKPDKSSLPKRMNKERTIASPVVLEGIGIHSGKYNKVVLYPSNPNSGIRIGMNDVPQPTLENVLPARVIGLERRTGVYIDGACIQTVEHLAAAFAYLGLNNLDIVMYEGNEIPAYDGSAWAIIRAILKAGVIEQGKALRNSSAAGHATERFGESLYEVEPYTCFRLDVTLDLLGQSYSSFFQCGNSKRFSRIMHSRPFILNGDLGALHSQGIGLGISESNCVFVNSEARFLDPDILQEILCHKMLDFIGDLYLAMLTLPCGNFRIRNPHHKYNTKFVCAITRTFV